MTNHSSAMTFRRRSLGPSITFVGTGEAFDTDGLTNTSLLYQGALTSRGRSFRLLLDCGYGVPHALWRLKTIKAQDPNFLDAVYLSHLHADHAWGLIPLLLAYHDRGRTRPLTIAGGPWLGPWIYANARMGYPGAMVRPRNGFKLRYPIEVKSFNPSQNLKLGPLTLRIAQSEHSVPNFAVRIEENKHSVCYSGDGRPTKATRSLFRDTDLLVHECFSVEESPVHADVEDLYSTALKARVKKLCPIHLKREEKSKIQSFWKKKQRFGEIKKMGMALVLPKAGQVLRV